MSRLKCWVGTFQGHYLPGSALVFAEDEFIAKKMVVDEAKAHGVNLTAGDITLKWIPIKPGCPDLYDGDY